MYHFLFLGYAFLGRSEEVLKSFQKKYKNLTFLKCIPHDNLVSRLLLRKVGIWKINRLAQGDTLSEF